MSDSDVRVESDYLRLVAAPFANSEVVRSPHFASASAGAALQTELDALGMCLDSVPSALVARKLEGKMQFAFAGRWPRRKCGLAENWRLGSGWWIITPMILSWGTASRRSGYRVELMQKPVCMVFPQESVGQIFSS